MKLEGLSRHAELARSRVDERPKRRTWTCEGQAVWTLSVCGLTPRLPNETPRSTMATDDEAKYHGEPFYWRVTE